MSSHPPEAVAVVIPSHNYARFLGEAISSALGQTHAPSAVIVIDDGSTDDTSSVVRSFDDLVIYVRTERIGANAARNLGLEYVGEATHVVFLDADDVLEAEYIAACLEALRGAPEASYAYTQMARFGDEDGTSNYPEWSLEELLRKNFIHISALFRAPVARRFRFDDRLKRGSMDWDRYLSLAAAGHSGVLVDRPLLRYRRHEASIQRQLRGEPRRRHLLALQLGWKHRRLYGWRRLARHTEFHLYKAAAYSAPTRLRRRLLRRFSGPLQGVRPL